VVRQRLEAKAREVYEAIGEDLPLRGPDGGPHPGDTVPVRLLAEALCRLEDVTAHLRDRGLLDSEGSVRPAVDLERRLRAEVLDLCRELGLTPRSRAALGLDLARGLDLATAMSERDPERRAEMMRQAGVEPEEAEDR
jgi:phage terminase small subunit